MKNPAEPDFFSKQVENAKRFYIEKSTGKDTRLTVVCGGCEQTRADFEINRNDFPYYCIEFVAQGLGSATLNGTTHQLKAGTLFSYGPGISQHITTVADRPMKKYFIDFTGRSVERMLKKLISPIGTAVSVNRPDAIARVLDDLLAHGLSDSPYKSMMCSILLEYLFYRIADLMTEAKNSSSKAFLTYQQCRQHIRKHFKTLNSLKEIAEACLIDHAYLCRLFKRFDTQSPYQYLQNLKMAYAADRFQETGALVKEVAYELGFDDPFHFTRVFKKCFGISPQAFKGLR